MIISYHDSNNQHLYLVLKASGISMDKVKTKFING